MNKIISMSEYVIASLSCYLVANKKVFFDKFVKHGRLISKSLKTSANVPHLIYIKISGDFELSIISKI